MIHEQKQNADELTCEPVYNVLRLAFCTRVKPLILRIGICVGCRCCFCIDGIDDDDDGVGILINVLLL